jgi:hypothetical protein
MKLIFDNNRTKWILRALTGAVVVLVAITLGEVYRGDEGSDSPSVRRVEYVVMCLGLLAAFLSIQQRKRDWSGDNTKKMRIRVASILLAFGVLLVVSMLIVDWKLAP